MEEQDIGEPVEEMGIFDHCVLVFCVTNKEEFAGEQLYVVKKEGVQQWQSEDGREGGGRW